MTLPRIDGVLLGTAAAVVAVVGVAAFSLTRAGSSPEAETPGLPAIAFERIAGAEGLENVTAIAPTTDGSGGLFVGQKDGLVRVYRDGALKPVLDLRGRVKWDEPEQGLLGVAPSPDFVSDRRIFVSYTRLDGDTVFAEFTLPAGRPPAERAFLVVPKETVWHHGGMLLFAPDGALLVSTGDDARAGTSRDRAGPYGKILRFDVSDFDTPPEVVAWGLRNPWRFAIDPGSRTLFISDVGEDAWEEVNTMQLEERSVDFGWDEFEGDQCYAETCSAPGSRRPSGQYSRQSSLAEHCAIVGGAVLHGLGPELDGTYIASDFCSGWVFGLRRAGDGWEWGTMLRPLQEQALHITSYAVTEDGDVLAASIDGSLYRVVAARP